LASGSIGCDDETLSPAGGDTTENRAAIATVVHRFYSAMKRGDPTAACALFAPDVRGRIGAELGVDSNGDCVDAFSEFLRMARRSGNLSPKLAVAIERIKLDGNTAVATVAVGASPLTELPLVKESDGWRIAATPAG
jgi:hypothetical protein